VRLVAVALVLLQLVAGCTSTRGPRPPAGPTLRDGPVAVRAELLADAEAQKRHFGRALEARLAARVLPLVVSLENVGARELVIVPSDLILETPVGERVVPMHAVALGEVFAETLGALAEGPRPRRDPRTSDYPALDLAMTIGTQICIATIFGCVVLLPPTLVGITLEASRQVGERLRSAEGRAGVREMQARDDALATVGGIALPPGTTAHGTVYFPAVSLASITGRHPFLVIRFTERASGNLAIVVRLDLGTPPPH
jgi:hypothetical protein